MIALPQRKKSFWWVTFTSKILWVYDNIICKNIGCTLYLHCSSNVHTLYFASIVQCSYNGDPMYIQCSYNVIHSYNVATMYIHCHKRLHILTIAQKLITGTFFDFYTGMALLILFMWYLEKFGQIGCTLMIYNYRDLAPLLPGFLVLGIIIPSKTKIIPSSFFFISWLCFASQSLVTCFNDCWCLVFSVHCSFVTSV